MLETATKGHPVKAGNGSWVALTLFRATMTYPVRVSGCVERWSRLYPFQELVKPTLVLRTSSDDPLVRFKGRDCHPLDIVHPEPAYGHKRIG